MDLSICQAKDNKHDTTTAAETSRERRLFQNLECYGWSPIRLDEATLLSLNCGSGGSDEARRLVTHYGEWNERHRELFADQAIRAATATTTNSSSRRRRQHLTYITAESGSPDAITTEAKQSWEFRRRPSSSSSASSSLARHHPAATTTAAAATTTSGTELWADLVERRMNAWTEILHCVAVQVRRALDLPVHLLVQEEDDEEEDEIIHGEKAVAAGASSSCSPPLDLLRAFCYDQVAAATTNGSAMVLGSSPHTDWGSFTIVWQSDDDAEDGGADDGGGADGDADSAVSPPPPPKCLQTYCHVHDTWNAVQVVVWEEEDGDASPPPPQNDQRRWLQFIVHVGDMTSLAVGRALQQQQQQQKTTATIPNSFISDNHAKDSNHQLDGNNTAESATTVLWPSPRHRVLSPTTQTRHSLVYFCYPPEDATLASITSGLSEWCDQQQHRHCSPYDNLHKIVIPYEDYSLLQNQSATAKDENTGIFAAAAASSSLLLPVTGRDRCEDLWNQPVREILDDKWRQVQR